MEREDVEQILAHMGVVFNEEGGNSDFSIFFVPQFGLKVIWSLMQYADPRKDWRTVIIYPTHMLNEAREEILWGLWKGGYGHYLRMNLPNTFNRLLAGREGEDWHQKIIKKRLEIFGKDPKHNYWRELNREGLRESSMVMLSLDPGFYDFMED